MREPAGERAQMEQGAGGGQAIACAANCWTYGRLAAGFEVNVWGCVAAT